MKMGDKVKFGRIYCEETGRPEFLGKTIMLTPQLFEEDDGLSVYSSECPGIYNKEAEEAESIYHLFGNALDEIYDCEFIPATEEDIKNIHKQQEAEMQAINEEYRSMNAFFAEAEK